MDDITEILRRWGRGEEGALDELIPLVYKELRRIAAAKLRQHERPDHSMGATSLVHDAYQKIRDLPQFPWKNRSQFFCAVTTVMVHVLVDYARMRRALKRGGGERPLPIGEKFEIGEVNPVDEGLSVDQIVALEIALDKLKTFDLKLYKAFVLRSIWGCSKEETAQLLEISAITVDRRHSVAKGFLKRELGE